MLIQVAERVWPPGVVHDTVAAVASEFAFRRSVRESIAQRLLLWIGEAIAYLIRLLRHSGATRPIGFGIVALVVLLVVARLVLAARARDEGVAPGAKRGRKAVAEDPFLQAEVFANDGRFEEAAHALYRGVLLALARNERLRLDPSKTSGDYARELRGRGSSSYQDYRAFARRFDVAVYGHEGCDAALITDLRALAALFLPRARAA